MTQKEKILKLLKKGDWISTREIMQQTMITRGPARINELRNDGYNIEAGDFDEYGFRKYRLVIDKQPALF